jgi:multicomponent Na+:H+ antiporter subunit A
VDRARAGRGAAGWILALLPLALTIHFASLLGPVARGQTLTEVHRWAPGLGVDLSFRADGLSLLFALLICGVGVPVVIHAGGYLAGRSHRGRFFAYLLMFMASMLGLVLADNILVLYVFWELTSISSYFLIGFHASQAEPRAAARQALLVTAAGGLSLLVGLLLLGIAGGSFELSVLLGRGDTVRAHPLYLPVLVTIGLGAATKSAQLPFHFWLPAAMAAPAPASAYLHSATMVKAGVYLLARLHPVLGGTESWRYGLSVVGAATAVTGALLAWNRTDLKRMLAYSTVSALGTLVMLLGWGTEAALVAAMVYLVAHAGYKGALFLVAGSIDHEAGTRDVTRLGGLWRAMPFSAFSAVLAGLSMAGAPPWLGFLAKEGSYAATLSAPVLLAATGFAGVVTVLVAGLAAVKPFFGPRRADLWPHEASAGMWIGSGILGASGLALGVASSAAGDFLVAPAASAAAGRPVHADLSLAHALSPGPGGGVSPVLLLGGATLLVGASHTPRGVGSAARRGRSWCSWGGGRPARTTRRSVGSCSWPGRKLDCCKVAICATTSSSPSSPRSPSSGRRSRPCSAPRSGAPAPRSGFTRPSSRRSSWRRRSPWRQRGRASRR